MSQANKEASINPESQAETIEPPAIVDGVHGYGREKDWVAPTDPLVLKHLEWYRDQKVGIFFHFGLYSQIGCVESWLLSDEDKAWSYKDLTWDSPKECQRQYKRLNRSFNPIRLVPEQWARTARECGMRYVILTTKHHDGFCLWDTAYTQYKTTASECPFSEHKHADIVHCKICFQCLSGRRNSNDRLFFEGRLEQPILLESGNGRRPSDEPAGQL